MNRYELALKWIGEQPILNEFGEEISDIKNDGSTKEEFNLLKELVEKAEKYKWHTDPNDLPKCSELINYYSVDVIVKLGDNAYEIGWYNFIQNRWICPIANAYGLEIKAWKYIEQFEGEKDEKQKEHK